MSTLKGNRAESLKRKRDDRLKGKNKERVPRMEPNIRVKSIKLEDILDNDEDA